jgi:hypothetical protein
MSFAIVAAACGPLQLPEPAPPEQASPRAETGIPEGTPPPAVAAPVVTPGVAPAARRIALLLPLSGAQRPVAEAVRDGFLAAYLAAGSGAQRPEVLVFDEERPGAAPAYRAALAAGADLIVGPLLKQSVAEVAAIAGSVTTLALNFLDATAEPPAGFYQFALSPEDEARQAAGRAAAEGRARALALAPDNDWGRRMLAAFIPAVEAPGGSVLAYRLYDPSATDFTAQLQRLLLLDESRARHSQLTANLGVSLAFEPRRRGDVDFIFLVANTAAGRLIWPQLRFLYAGDIPTYATSAINQPGADGDADLDGVMFTDVPALLGDDPRAANLRAALTARWPAGALGLMRFYAMGFDAYDLAASIGSGPPPALFGLTGYLTVDARRQFHRAMPWAEFRAGGIVTSPAVNPPAAP